MTAGLRVALGFMMLTFWARGQNASEVDLIPEIGPHSGDVTWSLRNHILTWNTPQLTLNLDPWFTLRHVSGTMSPLTQSPPTLTIDNLRGAHFDAQLDGIWRVEGSLEEMQGYIGAWEAVTMEEITALPDGDAPKSNRTDALMWRVLESYPVATAYRVRATLSLSSSLTPHSNGATCPLQSLFRIKPRLFQEQVLPGCDLNKSKQKPRWRDGLEQTADQLEGLQRAFFAKPMRAGQICNGRDCRDGLLECLVAPCERVHGLVNSRKTPSIILIGGHG